MIIQFNEARKARFRNKSTEELARIFNSGSLSSEAAFYELCARGWF